MRRRLIYVALAALTICAGLRSRLVLRTPTWLAKGVGDARYATLWFWLCGLCSPQKRAAARAALATAICFVIEFSQLYHAPWLDSLRATRLGYLVLECGFHVGDLAFYVCGALLGIAAERLGRRICGWND